jgi:hypothetical protein
VSLSFWLSHQYLICIPPLSLSCYMPCPQNKRTQISMSQVEFEPTIPVFEQAKRVNALDRTATVIGAFHIRLSIVKIILFSPVVHISSFFPRYIDRLHLTKESIVKYESHVTSRTRGCTRPTGYEPGSDLLLEQKFKKRVQVTRSHSLAFL